WGVMRCTPWLRHDHYRRRAPFEEIVIPGRRSETETSPESITQGLWLWIPGPRPPSSPSPRNDGSKKPGAVSARAFHTIVQITLSSKCRGSSQLDSAIEIFR